MMGLCVKLIKKNYGNISLITDRRGKDFFGHLGWTSISTDLDQMPMIPSEVWSFGKLWAIYVISNKKEPFIHIDHDFFLFKKLEDTIINSKVLVQSLEYQIKSMYKTEIYDKYCQNKYIRDYQSINYSYNCGIMGGTDYEFWNSYAKNAIRAVIDPKNKYYWWTNYPEFDTFVKACVAEQYFLGCYLKANGIKPTLLFDNEPKPKKDWASHYVPHELSYFYKTYAAHFYGHNKYLILENDNLNLNGFMNLLPPEHQKNLNNILLNL